MSGADVHSLGLAGTAQRLRQTAGLRLHTGPFVNALHSTLPDVATAVWQLYGAHALAADDGFIDFSVSVRRTGAPWRRGARAQVSFGIDGDEPFNPLPGDQGFPLLEWGLNWCVYSRCHQYLILHAAVLERHGCALVLPAPSGSGKSTLCAALLLNGWRLLSDELALIDPRDGTLVPNPRPVSLKNASIEVIAARAPGLHFGSRVRETSKGVVAHFAAPADAVARAAERARPGWVVLPRWRADAAARLLPLGRAQMMMELVSNAFNYDLFGAEGFELLASLVDGSGCFTFEYGSLDAALAVFDQLAAAAPTAATR